jgi:hypothetical protein
MDAGRSADVGAALTAVAESQKALGDVQGERVSATCAATALAGGWELTAPGRGRPWRLPRPQAGTDAQVREPMPDLPLRK